ncbi:hypothetical protein DDE82_003104 [Stemphylium lycopersici]|nr:hypothetical protein DDE82_003104 [Stemphylium lycopersici]
MNNTDSHPRVLSLSSPSSSIPATPAAHSRRESIDSAHDAHHFVALAQQQQHENDAKTHHKVNLSIKKMWDGVKKHASEHHRSVNAAYMASYGYRPHHPNHPSSTSTHAPLKSNPLLTLLTTPPPPVIHINLSVPEAKSSIPAILSSTAPPSTSSPNSGSQNYTQRPAAVALGGGFSDAMFEEIKASCGEEKILWLRMDNTRKTDMPDLSEREAFGRATAARLKTCLHGLGAGKEGAKTEGLFWF